MQVAKDYRICYSGFMERKALYNSLRINFRDDPSLKVLPWQVKDYRSYSLEELFSALEKMGIRLDRALFSALADEVDSPEELTEHLIAEEQEDPQLFDRLYLYVFELWRRICPEKQTISLFCDELDHQIDLFDSKDLTNPEGIEDVIAQLETILEDNMEEGGSPKELFQSILEGCAHDVEGFLYDYIEELLNKGNRTYAEELIDEFSPYMTDPKWFRVLELKAASLADVEKAQQLMRKLVQEAEKEKDLEFHLTLLDQAAQTAEKEAFFSLMRQTIPLLECEADVSDLLSSCEDFAHYADAEALENAVKKIHEQQQRKNPAAPVSKKDPLLIDLQSLFKNF